MKYIWMIFLLSMLMMFFFFNFKNNFLILIILDILLVLLILLIYMNFPSFFLMNMIFIMILSSIMGINLIIINSRLKSNFETIFYKD